MKYTDKPKFIVESIQKSIGKKPSVKKMKQFAEKSRIFELVNGKLVVK